MCQEKKEEEDSATLKIVWMHQCDDTKSTLKRLIKDKLKQLVAALTTGQHITKKKKWEEKQLYGYFKWQTNEISYEKTEKRLQKGNL